MFLGKNLRCSTGIGGIRRPIDHYLVYGRYERCRCSLSDGHTGAKALYLVSGPGTTGGDYRRSMQQSIKHNTAHLAGKLLLGIWCKNKCPLESLQVLGSVGWAFIGY